MPRIEISLGQWFSKLPTGFSPATLIVMRDSDNNDKSNWHHGGGLDDLSTQNSPFLKACWIEKIKSACFLIFNSSI